MKCVVFLALLAVCHSYPYGSGSTRGTGLGIFGSNVGLNQDGTVSIVTADGRKFIIAKAAIPNTITVTGSLSRSWLPVRDLLARILEQNQGQVNQGQLLQQINAAVQAGQINEDVYQALASLNQPWNWNQAINVRNPLQIQSGAIGGQIGQQQVLQQLLQEAQVPDSVQQQQVEQFLQQQLLGQQGSQVDDVLRLGGIVGQQQRLRGVGNAGLAGTVLNGIGQQQILTQGVGLANPLSQILQVESDIVDGQAQIQVQQLLQQQQQRQLLEQQQQQLLRQQQQQIQQQTLQELQAQIQAEQARVLEQQRQVQQQVQQPRGDILLGLLTGGRGLIGRGQQGIWQQQPGVVAQIGSLGGVSGLRQGIQRLDIPVEL